MHQIGIFDETPTHHFFLEYVLADGADIGRVARCVSNLQRTGDPARRVLAFGTGLARRLFDEALPADFSDFEPIDGVRRKVPATPRDLWVWVHADNSSDALDAMLAVQAAVRDCFRLALDVAGFRYHDSRDLTGFVDGSANPKGDAQHAAALVQTGPAAAGSIVFTQCWEHDLAAFHALAENEQERVIGRTKPDSIELQGDEMPPDSHVSRTDLKVDGVSNENLSPQCAVCERESTGALLSRLHIGAQAHRRHVGPHVWDFERPHHRSADGVLCPNDWSVLVRPKPNRIGAYWAIKKGRHRLPFFCSAQTASDTAAVVLGRSAHVGYDSQRLRRL